VAKAPSGPVDRARARRRPDPKRDVASFRKGEAKGEKHPADMIGNAAHVMRIATGEIEETPGDGKRATAASLGRIGGRVRSENLSPTKA
jgi:hypothetical protein